MKIQNLHSQFFNFLSNPLSWNLYIVLSILTWKFQHFHFHLNEVFPMKKQDELFVDKNLSKNLMWLKLPHDTLCPTPPYSIEVQAQAYMHEAVHMRPWKLSGPHRSYPFDVPRSPFNSFDSLTHSTLTCGTRVSRATEKIPARASASQTIRITILWSANKRQSDIKF